MSEQRNYKLPPKDWVPFFEAAGILSEELDQCKSEHSKAIKLGQFLSPKVGREVTIQVGDRTGKAILCVEQDRAKTKRYYLKVIWASPSMEQESADESNPREENKRKAKASDAAKGKARPREKKKPKRCAKRTSKKASESRSAPAPSGNSTDEAP